MTRLRIIVSGLIGGTSDFDRGNQPSERICGWEDLRELAAHGVSIQAPSASHRRFSEIGKCELIHEIHRPKEILGEWWIPQLASTS